MERERFTARHLCSPFDDYAVERQKRMGLLKADGKPDMEAIAVVARLYAGFSNTLPSFVNKIFPISFCVPGGLLPVGTSKLAAHREHEIELGHKIWKKKVGRIQPP